MASDLDRPKPPVNLSNRSMPSGTVTAELAYADVREAVEWLGRVFGFAERLRIADHRAQLTFGDGSVIVTALPADLGREWTADRAGHSVMVRVADVDSHYAHTLQCGARIIHVPANYPYGERQYTAEDPQGRRWTFSQTIADVEPQVWGGELVG